MVGAVVLVQYGEEGIRRAVPLAMGLMCASNPKLTVLDTLSKLSHDGDPEVCAVCPVLCHVYCLKHGALRCCAGRVHLDTHDGIHCFGFVMFLLAVTDTVLNSILAMGLVVVLSCYSMFFLRSIFFRQ
jgi:hypothetical protein